MTDNSMPNTSSSEKPRVFIATQTSPWSTLGRFALRTSKVFIPIVIVGVLAAGIYFALKPDPVKRARIDKITQFLVQKGVEPKEAEKRAVIQIEKEDAAAARRRLAIEAETKRLVESGYDLKLAKMQAEIQMDLDESRRESEKNQRDSDAAFKEHMKVIDEVDREIKQWERDNRKWELEQAIRKSK